MLTYILVPLPFAILFLIFARKNERAFKYLALIGYTTCVILSIVLDHKDFFDELSLTNMTFKQVLNL